LGFVLLNFVLKGLFISHNAIALDEPFSIYYAQMNLSSIIEFLSTGNNPPLYELFLHFWINVFGISALSVRIPSLIFSCITIFFIYKLASTFFNNRIAIYASVFYLFSNNAILYAHEARVYSLFALLTTLSMYCFFSLINNKPFSNLQKALFILIQSLLIYAHYFGFFILFLQVAFILFNKNLRNIYWKRLLSFSLIILLLYTPNIKVLINRFLDSSLNGTWVAKTTGIEDLYNMLVHFSNAPVLAVCVIIIFVLAVIKSFKETHLISLNGQLLIIWFLVPFLFMFFLSYWVPVFIERYLMFLSTGFYLLLAITVDYLDFKKPIKYLAPIIFCVLFLFTTDTKNTNKRNVIETVEKIKELKSENSILYISPKWFDLNFVYYYKQAWFQDIEQHSNKTKMHDRLRSENIYFIKKGSEIYFKELKQFEKILFLDVGSKSFSPNTEIIDKLSQFGKLKEQHEFHEIFTLYEFSVKE
tara:strand:- start:6518 stop:7936 length:1419 start_codon:yes stop_codon:yes gene_type:complete